MKRNMLTRTVGSSSSLLVIRHNTKDATEEDWKELLDFLVRSRDDLEQIRILIMTDGGIPTAAQRKQLAQALGQAQVLVASVSDSMKVRFVSSTISLFARGFRQYTKGEVEQAYDHLGLTVRDRRLAESALRELEVLLYSGEKQDR